MLWQIFVSFMKIGALTFGGGYAMMPMFQSEIMKKRGWATAEEILDYYSLAQCIPGVIAINTSVFIGKKVKGTPGGIVAALGVATPSIVIITLIAAFLSNFMEMEIVKHAFAGIRVGVCVLIIGTLLGMYKKAIVDWKTLVIFIIVACVSIFTDLSPILFVVGAAVAGIVITALKRQETPS